MRNLFVLVIIQQLYMCCYIASESSPPMGVVPVGDVLNNMLRLERAVTNLTWMVTLTRNELQTTKTELETTKTMLQYTKKMMMSLVSNETKSEGRQSAISFQVKQIQDTYTAVANKPLKFDDVTLNEGEGYNSTSGVFEVPKKGTYLCWANVLSPNTDYFVVSLMKGGQTIVRGYTGRDQRHGTATFTYMVSLNKGELIWFAVTSGSSYRINGENFSGYGCYLMCV